METIESISPNNENLEIDSEATVPSIERLLNDNDYKEIEQLMLFEYKKSEWGFYSGDFARPEINESEYVIKGTLRLVKKTLDASKEGEPYDTIIFLDKSARPGAYFYKKMTEILVEKGYIPSEFAFPEIKFMDVGKSGEEKKIKTSNTAEYAREIINPKYLGHNVLLVDEFRDSGATLANAVAEFNGIFGEHIPNLEIDSVYQFNENHVAPFWYRDSSTKSLVQDANILGFLNAIDTALKDDDESPLKKFTYTYTYKDERGKTVLKSKDYYLNTNLSDIKLYKSLSGKLSKEVFVNLFESVEKGSDYEDLEYIIRNSSPLVDINLTRSEIEAVLKSKDVNIAPGSLYDYFKYAGGRFAAPYHGDRSAGLELREMLKKLSELVAERIEKV